MGDPGSWMGPWQVSEAALIAHIEGDDPRADALLDRAATRSASSEASLMITEQHRLWLAAMRRDVALARRSAADCRSLAKRLDYALYGHTAELVGGWADAVLGEAAGAQQADLAFDRYLATGLRMLEPLYLLLLAEATRCPDSIAGPAN